MPDLQHARWTVRRILAPVTFLALAGVVAWTVLGLPGQGSGVYRVRALFDNAGFAVPGEQVRIAGAPVGRISGISVTRNKLAAVTLAITASDFKPWYSNATCTIRPQSLIAERYVDCTPGSAGRRALQLITSGDGAGSHLLPVTRTSSPIDPDIVQNISQESVRQSLSLIINELGTGLAGRGADLNAVILRANPALAQTERVFNLLATQNRVLAKLATDASTVLAPLAKTRRALADFVTAANTTAIASATQRRQLAGSIRLLPTFLARLQPLMADLGRLADQATPVISRAGASAGALDSEFRSLVPFANRAKTAIKSLGSAAQQSQSALIRSLGLAQQLGRLGSAAEPASQRLQKLVSSLNSSGGIQQLLNLLFYGAGATNGYNAAGHYVRFAPVVGPCTAYARTPVAGCSANFSGATSAAAAVAKQAVGQVLGGGHGAKPTQTGTLGRLLHYLTGTGR